MKHPLKALFGLIAAATALTGSNSSASSATNNANPPSTRGTLEAQFDYIDPPQVQSWTVPATYRFQYVIMVGVGGGGGGARGGTEKAARSGGGGGGGSQAWKVSVSVRPGYVFTMEIGKGGAGAFHGDGSIGLNGNPTLVHLNSVTYTFPGGLGALDYHGAPHKVLANTFLTKGGDGGYPSGNPAIHSTSGEGTADSAPGNPGHDSTKSDDWFNGGGGGGGGAGFGQGGLGGDSDSMVEATAMGSPGVRGGGGGGGRGNAGTRSGEGRGAQSGGNGGDGYVAFIDPN